jgi:hypothetical protein
VISPSDIHNLSHGLLLAWSYKGYLLQTYITLAMACCWLGAKGYLLQTYITLAMACCWLGAKGYLLQTYIILAMASCWLGAIRDISFRHT